MKIVTKDGHEHILKWIEEKDGNVFNITNTKRIFVKKDKIKGYVINNPTPTITSLETALDFDGIVYVATNDNFSSDNITYFKYEFFNVEDQGEYIRGIKMTGKDTVSVMIPIEQIETINMRNNDLTFGVPIMGTTMILIAGFIWYALSNISIQPFQ